MQADYEVRHLGLLPCCFAPFPKGRRFFLSFLALLCLSLAFFTDNVAYEVRWGAGTPRKTVSPRPPVLATLPLPLLRLPLEEGECLSPPVIPSLDLCSLFSRVFSSHLENTRLESFRDTDAAAAVVWFPTASHGFSAKTSFVYFL